MNGLIETDILIGNASENIEEKFDSLIKDPVDHDSAIEIEQNGHLSSLNVGSGMTQSDESLNCSNPSYCYGNQVEYSGSFDYGHASYPCENDIGIEFEENENSPNEMPPNCECETNQSDENDICDKNKECQNSDSPDLSTQKYYQPEIQDMIIKKLPLVSVPSLTIDNYNVVDETV